MFDYKRFVSNEAERQFIHIYKHSFAKIVFFLAVILLFASCDEHPTKTDAERLAQNHQDTAELKRIQSVIISTKIILASDYESLKNLRAKYPASVDVRQTFQAALILRNDWEALEKFLTEIPQEQRTKTGQIELTKVYIKQGKTAEAANVIEPMTVAAPNNAELNGLAGQAFFFTGQYDKAAVCLDRVWSQLISNKRVDEISIRGLIYFYKGDYQKAIETLQETIKIDPKHIAALNGLSRVYSVTGDEKQADVYRLQVEKISQETTTNETNRAAFTERARELETAWNEKRYEDVIKTAQEMLSIAPHQQKAILYQYIAEACQALGKTEEAKAAMIEAEKFKQTKMP